MKKYKFRLKTYFSCMLVNLLVLGIGYFVVPKLQNFPPHSEVFAFQLKVEGSTHIQQYISMYFIVTIATLICISVLYKNIFRLYEGKKVNKTITEIRQKAFYIMLKVMIFEVAFISVVIFILALTTPNTTVESKIKMVITYSTVAGVIAVITDFILSPGLKKFIIWSGKKEENHVFNYKKSLFKNRVIQRIVPLIIIVIVIVCFFSYSLVIKQVGEKNYNYYRGEIQKLNISNTSFNNVLNQLNSVGKLSENDFYFYSINKQDFIGDNGQNFSEFLTEYLKDFSQETNGHIYDFYGVETEGYVESIKLSTGEEIYIGFIYSISNTNILMVYLGVFVLLLVVTVIYLRAFVKTITTDITDVCTNLNKIASNEKDILIEKIPITSNDEIGEIVSAYNKIQELNQHNINDLNIAKEQAEKANNYKTEFLSSMSHEIRTPLNAIVGFSNALAEEDIPDTAKEEVKDIVMASNILLDIVNSILDISKIEANKVEIINSEYRTMKMFNELVSLTKARMGDKPLDFRTSIDPNIPGILYGDHSRLKQVLINLLTNAVKYTKEGFVEFKVNCVIVGDICKFIIAIEDSGVGIKPEDIKKLFNKFERLDAGNTSSIEGTGLGLAITQKLIELMGGEIVVQSVYGEGSKFTVTINQRIVKVETEIEPQINDTQELKKVDFSDKKVLVVDDNKLNLKVAARLLSAFNLQITTVESGFECLDKIKAKENYDLILLDDMMPKLSGSDTLKQLRETSDFAIPVIVLTANAIVGMREKYLEMGFDDYLAKPIEKIELYRVLIEYLSNKK